MKVLTLSGDFERECSFVFIGAFCFCTSLLRSACREDGFENDIFEDDGSQIDSSVSGGIQSVVVGDTASGSRLLASKGLLKSEKVGGLPNTMSDGMSLTVQGYWSAQSAGMTKPLSLKSRWM